MIPPIIYLVTPLNESDLSSPVLPYPPSFNKYYDQQTIQTEMNRSIFTVLYMRLLMFKLYDKTNSLLPHNVGKESYNNVLSLILCFFFFSTLAVSNKVSNNISLWPSYLSACSSVWDSQLVNVALAWNWSLISEVEGCGIRNTNKII